MIVGPLPGTIHRHYKGGKYLVVAVAQTHNHNGDMDVVYVSLRYGHHVTRPLEKDSRNEDSWTDLVTWPDGIHRKRFIHDDIQSPELFETLFPNEILPPPKD